MTSEDARRYFAEDLRVTHGLRSTRLVDAIAATPRERFLPAGPWLLRGPYDTGVRSSDDADPRHVYHDVAIGIDPSRNLFNGQPSLVAGWIESLNVDEGARVLHIGCGTGYFTAWLAAITGSAGKVFAIDVDPQLAARAGTNLRGYPWVEVRAGDGLTGLPADIDVLIVHAGATHVADAWLDTLGGAGRMLVPLTCTCPGMPANISKGMVLRVARRADAWEAKFGFPVAIYSLVGARDDAAQALLGKALKSGTFQQVTRLRRDRHDAGPSCWLHGTSNCLATGEIAIQ